MLRNLDDDIKLEVLKIAAQDINDPDFVETRYKRFIRLLLLPCKEFGKSCQVAQD
jgi:hypothetical protein